MSVLAHEVVAVLEPAHDHDARVGRFEDVSHDVRHRSDRVVAARLLVERACCVAAVPDVPVVDVELDVTREARVYHRRVAVVDAVGVYADHAFDLGRIVDPTTHAIGLAETLCRNSADAFAYVILATSHQEHPMGKIVSGFFIFLDGIVEAPDQ